MDNNEIKIYYTNYDLENSTKNICNHSLSIKVLLLLSNRILIPPTHFLKMGYENLDILKNFKEVFNKGYICTSLYNGFNNVSDYLSFKIENDKNYKNTYKYRLESIDYLFDDSKSIIKSKAEKQGGEFSSIFLDQLVILQNNAEKSSIVNEINLAEKYISEVLFYNKKGFLYKAELQNELSHIKTEKKISKSLLDNAMILIDRSYYIAGATHNNSILSYTNYFEEIAMPLTYGNHQITSIIYSVDFFIMIMKVLGIIESINDFDKLSVKDIIALKNTNEFKKFMIEYSGLCDIIQGNINLINIKDYKQIVTKKSRIKWWNKLSNCLIAMGLLPIDYVIGQVDGMAPIPILTIILIALNSFCSNSKVEKIIKRNTVDKININITKKFDAFSSFCFQLKEKLIDQD